MATGPPEGVAQALPRDTVTATLTARAPPPAWAQATRGSSGRGCLGLGAAVLSPRSQGHAGFPGAFRAATPARGGATLNGRGSAGGNSCQFQDGRDKHPGITEQCGAQSLSDPHRPDSLPLVTLVVLDRNTEFPQTHITDGASRV